MASMYPSLLRCFHSPYLIPLQVDSSIQQELSNIDRSVIEAGIEGGVVVRGHRHSMLQEPLCHPILVLSRKGVEDVCRVVSRLDALVHQCHRGLKVQAGRGLAEQDRGRGGDLPGRTLVDQVFGDTLSVVSIGVQYDFAG